MSERLARRWDMAIGISVTGIEYGIVLAKIHEPHGWQETSTNTVFHYIVPINRRHR